MTKHCSYCTFFSKLLFSKHCANKAVLENSILMYCFPTTFAGQGSYSFSVNKLLNYTVIKNDYLFCTISCFLWKMSSA